MTKKSYLSKRLLKIIAATSCALLSVLFVSCSDNHVDPNGNEPNPENPEPQNEPNNGYKYKPLITEVMPAIRINTNDGSNDFATKYNSNTKDQITYVGATISVDNCEEKYQLENIDAKVKARGNGSLNYSKKAFRIKFDKKQKMLGLNNDAKFKSRVLLADWNDLSMTNNPTAFYLGKTILGSDGYYCSDYRNVEVYINGQYWGVYLLCEQQEAKGESGRTSVPQVPTSVDDNDNEVGYTGTDIGYFFEYDSYAKDEGSDGDPIFSLNYNNKAPLTKMNGSTYRFSGGGFITATQYTYTIKNDIYDNSQVNFISSYLENVYRIVYNAVYSQKYYKFNDNYTSLVTTTGDAQTVVSNVLDVQSLADMYILQEIACDSDLSWSSFFMSLDMSKDGKKKVIFEAPWDFDLSFGIRVGYEQNGGTTWYAANCNNPWLIILINQTWFQDMIKDKWNELCENDILKNALNNIETQKNTYASYYTKNYQKWSERITSGGQRNQIVSAVNINKTQADGAQYLTTWLHSRFNFLNNARGNGKDVLD